MLSSRVARRRWAFGPRCGRLGRLSFGWAGRSLDPPCGLVRRLGRTQAGEAFAVAASPDDEQHDQQRRDEEPEDERIGDEHGPAVATSHFLPPLGLELVERDAEGAAQGQGEGAALAPGGEQALETG